jgi:hypothetical protein
VAGLAAGTGGVGTTTGASLSLNSDRQVCISLVTFFSPDVMALSLFNSAKRLADGFAGRAGAAVTLTVGTTAASGAATATPEPVPTQHKSTC